MFKAPHQSLYSSDLCIHIIYSFVLTISLRMAVYCWSRTVYVYGYVTILYNLCAYVGVYKRLLKFVNGYFFEKTKNTWYRYCQKWLLVWRVDTNHSTLTVGLSLICSLVFQLSGPCFGIQSLSFNHPYIFQ